VAIVLSAQHSNEDNFALLALARTFVGAKNLYVSGRPLGRGDKILMSEDKNPNTRGVMQLAGSMAPKPIAALLDAVKAGKYSFVIALGAELEVDAQEALGTLSKLKGLVTIAAHDGPLVRAAHVALPAAAWAETDGTYVNRQGLAQRSEPALRPRGDATPGWDLVTQLGKKLGYAMTFKSLADVRRAIAAETRTDAGANGAARTDADRAATKPEVSA
jgi:NADH-quinone oxidoreductase subunit G